MKSGTGDDPFADDTTEDDDEEAVEAELDAEIDTETEAADSTPETGTSESETGEESGQETASTADATTSESDTEPVESSDIPWVLRRSGVKEDRPNMTQFFLRDATDQAERDFRRDVEKILEKDVYLLDLREAAYQVAMEHPDEVAAVLEDWGYDYL